MRYILIWFFGTVNLFAQNIYIMGSIDPKQRDDLFSFLKEINADQPLFGKELVYLYSGQNDHAIRFLKEQWIQDSTIERWLDTRPKSVYTGSLPTPSTKITPIDYPEAEINVVQNRFNRHFNNVPSKENKKRKRHLLTLIKSNPDDKPISNAVTHTSWPDLISALESYNKRKLPVDIFIVFDNKIWNNIDSTDLPILVDPSPAKRLVGMCKVPNSRKQLNDDEANVYFTFKFKCAAENLKKVRMDIEFLDVGDPADDIKGKVLESGSIFVPFNDVVLEGDDSQVEIENLRDGYVCVKVQFGRLFSAKTGDICLTDGSHNYRMRLNLVESDLELAQNQKLPERLDGKWVTIKFFSPPEGSKKHLSICECKK